VRNTTVLIELLGRRILVDPCFAPGLGAPGVWSAAPPALSPASCGPIDVVLVTGSAPGCFDDAGFARLNARGATVLVVDERSRHRALRAGHTRRVRVVRPGDVVDVGPLVITASPARPLVGAGVGFHVRGRVPVVDSTPPGGDVAGTDPRGGDAFSLWHTGAVPPLEVDAAAAGFAAEHPADLVLGVCPTFGLRSGGPAWSAGLDDVAALARQAGASALVPLGGDVDVSPLWSGVVAARRLGAPNDSASDGLRIVDEPPGTWLRTGTVRRRRR
jgi:hypothetical protein